MLVAGKGGPRSGPALPVQLALSDRLLLGRVLRGLAGVLRSLTGGSSGVASGSGGIASGRGSGVNRSASGVGGGSAGSGSGVGSGVARDGGGVNSSGGSLARLGSGVLRGLDGLFLLRAAGKGQGSQGGGKCDLRVHVKFPINRCVDETVTQQPPGAGSKAAVPAIA